MRFSTSLLLWVLLGLSWQAQAQTLAPQVTLDWKGQELIFPTGSRGVYVPSFKGAVFASGQRLPAVSLYLPGYITDVQLQDARYAPFTAKEAAAFAGAAEPVQQFTLRHGTENRQPATIAQMPAVRRNSQTGQLEKLVSFGYTTRTGTAPQARTTSRNYAQRSALFAGDWYKIGVTNNDLGTGGVYKLDKNYLRSLMGQAVQNMDPRKLQLFGYGLGMLPQANSTERPDDLAENAIYFADNGSNNATFDDDEYFLFYARGPHTWSYSANDQRFRHELNIYTDTTYYFLTVGATNGRRVATQPAVSGTPTATITEYTDHFFYERELVNLLKSGRQWLGEGFNRDAQKEFTFSGINNLVPGAPLKLTSSVAATSLPGRTTTFTITLNGTSVGIPQAVRGVFCDPTQGACYAEAAIGDLTTYTTTAPASGSDLRVGMTYSGSLSDAAATGYLDYLEIQARRRLQLSGRPMEFRSLDNLAPNAISAFEVQSAPTNLVVWDVTNPRLAQNVTHSNGRFLAQTSSLREYVAFTPNGSFDTPRAFGKVANQNLHALGLTAPVDLVIVTPPVFQAQAQRLADHRRAHDQLNPLVVTPQQIYNEFSSGGQDITAIRDFVKMIYDRRAGQPGRLYVLLFGDASYDYKSDAQNDAAQLPGWWRNRQLRDADNQNFIPTYESFSSFDRIYLLPSFCSDDYFGFLDDDEGEWAESDGSDLMDAAVGRLPVRFPVGQPNSAAEAVTMVDKLIAYDSPVTQGKWRNRVTFVADDGDENIHLGNSEAPANLLVNTRPAYQVNKVYLDMYPQQSSAAGQSSPAASAALDASIEQGSLMVSYAGHGGPRGWMDEKILTNNSVLALQNTERPTFMFTGTCDFAWYDDPGFTSAGEQLLTDTRAGGIGLFTTTRLVYAANNQALANAFIPALFTRNSSTGNWPRLGDAVVAGKNGDGVDVRNRNFTLLGDPSMRLAMPYYTVRATRISDAQDPAHASIDTIRALQQVRLEGEVVHPVTSALQTSFNGRVQVTVYEKPSTVLTLGNESDTARISVQKDVVYDGKATVRNGRFQVQFVVPKDINYSFGFGKISFYAADSTQNIDGQGANPRISIGGASATALNDTIPPDIKLAMDTEQFVFGGLTKPNTTLLGRFSDDNGINTAGTGIGHELTATLDNDASKVTVLNEYYTADTDKFTSGRVSYLFKNLTVGPHVLRVKAWDTFNNSAEKEVEFIVARDEKLALEHILNYPNPFAGHTTFHFDHNRFGDALDVQVQIFTVSGKLVRTLTAYVAGSQSHVSAIQWDGRDDYNDQLARGVYVYRLSVRTPRDGSQVSKFEKLVLLN
ncbi:type IX secretion system sortase PorU [Hymenobacter sp. 15J16-1T3B]|uniref:type IX secretion system sortase PorU n=1 Tax=Hymenobacter sp. 15J16-1T3B TaxID=2886941 RepID=UPI001D0F5F1D|nr:type IX secretion system sortase PorU [Hymenobacter sp. 15J16-1T3B]MCC3157875.1 type IX secretion system sortase PorU [Hymenobacter sp. 15J16-1T3B]